jgi:hypothetical protein
LEISGIDWEEPLAQKSTTHTQKKQERISTSLGVAADPHRTAAALTQTVC